MNDPRTQQDVTSDEVELDLDEQDLEEVEISDQTLEQADLDSKEAKRQAKKTAKKLLSPEEKSALRKKRMLIGSAAALGVIVILLLLPFTRWPILNAVGFRGTTEVMISDPNNRAVVGAIIKLDTGSAISTDTFGRATFTGVALGKRTALVQKNGYGDRTFQFTSGIKKQKVTESLKIIGIKIDLDIKNWLSDQLIEGATTTYEKSNAVTDSTGRASLVIPPTDKKAIEVTIAAPGYITKAVEVQTNTVSKEVALVSAQKNYFLSKREGKFDVFSSNLDGSDQRKIIDATGKEDDSLLQFSVNKNNKQAVLVATRDGKIQNGRIVAGVYSVDLEKASLRKIDEGSDIQLYEWSDATIAYSKSAPELNYDDPSLSRIMTYNSATNKLSQTAAANYFTAVTVANSKLFYNPADAYRPIENGVLTSLDLSTGAQKKYMQDRQIAYLSRASYQTLEIQDTAGASFELQIASGTTKPIDRRPTVNLQVATNPSSQIAAWTDRRDGQGALVKRSIKDGVENVVVKISGLTSPVRFVTDTVVVARVATSEETADYVVDISTGKFKKVVDVSNVGTLRQSGL
jgi:hypothetical protein